MAFPDDDPISTYGSLASGAAPLVAAAAGGPAAPILAAGIPAALQLYSFFRQTRQRNRLQREDVTPAYAKEALALARQRAYAPMPGYGQALNTINQQTANTVGAAARGATSGGAFLGALSAVDQNARGAQAQLGAQNATYQAGQQAALQAELNRQAQWQEQGRREYAGARGALDQARFANLAGAASTLGQGAMYAFAARGLRQSSAAVAPQTAPAAVTPSANAYGQFMPQLPTPVSPALPASGAAYYDLLRRGYPMADYTP